MYKDEYIPTQHSKLKVFLLCILVIIIYFIDNRFVAVYFNSLVFNYILKPTLWGIIIFIVLFFRNIRYKGIIRFNANIKLWAFNLAVMYIVVLVFSGLIDGLGKSPYDHSLNGMMYNLITVGTMIVGREFVRNYAVNSLTKKENYLIFVLISLFMTMTYIKLNNYLDIKGLQGAVEFIARDFGPEFSHNLLATYLAFVGGPIPPIIYLGIKEAFYWLSPILPDLKWITQGLIGITFPIFAMIFVQGIYIKMTKQIKRNEKAESTLSWVITSIASIAIIWFSVGVFPVYPSVIATGSMEPMIKPGDVILVKKIDGNEAKLGDVIQFRKDNILISHRIMEVIEEDNVKKYITKGDNNSVEDSDPVLPEQIKGKIIKVVPKIGWPTLLIKSKKDIPLEQVVF